MQHCNSIWALCFTAVPFLILPPANVSTKVMEFQALWPLYAALATAPVWEQTGMCKISLACTHAHILSLSLFFSVTVSNKYLKKKGNVFSNCHVTAQRELLSKTLSFNLQSLNACVLGATAAQ